ncbi:hypothetical protein M9458_036653, partial [Cirrhinus mrigala]
MDAFTHPEYLLLLLEQGDRSLKGHRFPGFLEITSFTNYLDDTLCSFHNASFNTACRALSSEDGPREDFAAFVEWILARNRSEPERETVPESSQERASVPRGSSKSLEAHKCPPSSPLLPPSLLSSGSPSAHPQPTLSPPSVQWAHRGYTSLHRLHPLSPPPASESRTPPQL